jgi:hypothetical protein
MPQSQGGPRGINFSLSRAVVENGPDKLKLIPQGRQHPRRLRHHGSATLTFAVGSIWPFVFNEETPEVYTTNAALPAA